MRKIYLTFLTPLIFSNISFAQDKSVVFGDNVAAGKYYRINGFNMYYEIYGTGKPLRMIPGNGGKISAFSKNIPYFLDKYQVIVADKRAQGKSTDLTDSLSFEMMADDYAKLLDTLGVTKADVIGWSDGAINSLMLSIRHPEKVSRIAITGANLWPDSTAVNPASWKEEHKTYEKYKNLRWNSTDQKNKWKLFKLDWLQPHISLVELEGIQIPALITCGDHDVIKLEHTILIYKHISKSFLGILPASGHDTLIAHADKIWCSLAPYIYHDRYS